MASERKRRTDLPGYFKGISRRLELQVELMTPVIVHSGEMGDNDHGWFADLLRQYLPQKFGVDTGFVVNCDSDKGSSDFFAVGDKPRTQDPFISPQMDILLFDVLHNAPFCVEKTFKVCPVEMVMGAVEVTRHLDADKLRKDCAKLIRVKELATNKQYSGRRVSHWVFPLTFAVGLNSSMSEEAVVEVLASIKTHYRPDGVFLLDKAFYWIVQQGKRYYKIEEDRLFQFIAIIRRELDSMPVYGADLQTYFASSATINSQEARKIIEKT